MNESQPSPVPASTAVAPSPTDPPRVHPTAVVSADAWLAPGVVVGPYAVIDGPARIGSCTSIGAHAWIAGHVILGEGNRVFHGAVIGAEPQDLAYVPCESSVRIGDRNVFREYCTIHRGTAAGSATVVGDDCYFMAQSHAGHNCEIGNSVVVCNNALLAGHVAVGDRAFLSGNVMVHQFARVGTMAMLSGGARVTQDAPPYTIVHGSAVRGLNVVGLRRGGVDPAGRAALKAAFRLLFRSGLAMSEALDRADAELEATPEVSHLVEFIRTSRRGVCTAGPAAAPAGGGSV